MTGPNRHLSTIQRSSYEPTLTETGDSETQVEQLDEAGRWQHGQPASTAIGLNAPESNNYSAEGFLSLPEMDSQLALPGGNDWDSIVQDLGSEFSSISQSISQSKDSSCPTDPSACSYSSVETGSSMLGPPADPPLSQVQHVRHLLMLNDDDEAGHNSEAIIGGAFTLGDIIRAGVNSLASKVTNTSDMPNGHHLELAYEPRNAVGAVDSCSGSAYICPQSYHPTYSSSHLLPDPVRNHIRINQLALKAACLTNASLLGVAGKMVLARNCRSPFYWPNQDVEATRALFSDTKGDLRPCPSQITDNHHIYIDLIPFPVFRERVLALRATSPPILDEIELMQDLDKDGLIC